MKPLEAQAVEVLTTLSRLDADASRAYARSRDLGANGATLAMLTEFEADHERHAAEVEAMIRQLGGRAPSRAPRLEGLLFDAVEAVRRLGGDGAARTAARRIEELAERGYRAASTHMMPDDAVRMVWRHRDDLYRHMRTLEPEAMPPEQSQGPGGQAYEWEPPLRSRTHSSEVKPRRWPRVLGVTALGVGAALLLRRAMMMKD